MLRSCSQEDSNKLAVLSKKKQLIPNQKIIRVNIGTKKINENIPTYNNTNNYSYTHTNSKQKIKRIEEKNKKAKKIIPKSLLSRKNKKDDLSNYSTNTTNFNKKKIGYKNIKSRFKTPNLKPSNYSSLNTENKKNNIILNTNTNVINNTNNNINNNTNSSFSNSKIKKLVSNSCLMTDSNINDLLLSTENFEKELLTKYLDGTDDMINEDLESFTGSNNSNSFNNDNAIKTERKQTYVNTSGIMIDENTEKSKKYKNLIPRNSSLKYPIIEEIPLLKIPKKNKIIKFFNNNNKKTISKRKGKETELLNHSNNIKIPKITDKSKNTQKTNLINVKKFNKYRGNSTINKRCYLDIILEQKHNSLKIH